MKRYLSRLSSELIQKMDDNHWSIAQMSAMCHISYHGMCNIVNGNVNDINFSTFIKICENAHISYANIFDVDDSELLEKEMKKFILSNGKLNFSIQKV